MGAAQRPGSPSDGPAESFSRGRRIRYLLIIGALVGLGPFTIDMYLPAFPVLAGELQTTQARVQLTLTATTLGLALGQLLIGPLSDRVGRRLPLLLATSLHIASSVGIVVAPTIDWITALRLIQGFSAAASAVVALAMVRDLFAGDGLVRMLSRVALVHSLTPVIAPFLGAQILHLSDWRGVFWALAAASATLLLAVAVFVPETFPADRRSERGGAAALRRYRVLLADRVFVGVVLVGSLQVAALFCFVSSAPFLLQDVYGFSARQFGVILAVVSIGQIIGTQLASPLMRLRGPHALLRFVLPTSLLVTIAILVVELVASSVPAVLGLLFLLLLTVGVGTPTVQLLALRDHPNEAGTAASLLGAARFGMAGLVSPVVGLLGITSAVPMASVMIVILVLASLLALILVRPSGAPTPAR